MNFTKGSTKIFVLFCSIAFIAEIAAAQSPSYTLLIANQDKRPSEDSLLVVDPIAKKVVYRIHVEGQPHNVAVSDDGKFAYTSNLTRGAQWLNYPGAKDKPEASLQIPAGPLPDDAIGVIDLKAHKLVRMAKIGPGAEPHGITFGGGKVYFSAEGWKLVGRYDPATNRVDWMGGIGQNRVHELVVTKDGSRLFTANIGSDSIAAISPWDAAVDKQTYSKGEQAPPWNAVLIPAGNGSEGIAMSPDEKEVWVLNRADGTATIVDVATRKVKETIDIKSKDALRVTFTPDSGRVLISDTKSGEVLVLDARSRKEIKRIANVGSQAHGLVVSPDGRFAYAAVQSSADVAIIDMATYEIVGRIPLGTGTKPFDGIDGMTLGPGL